MKKVNLLFVIFVLLIFSCKKVVTEANLASNVDVKSTSRNMNVSLEEMVKNPLDKEDEAFNKQLLLLAKGVLEIAKDQDNSQKLISSARTSPESEVNLNCFLNTWNNCKCTFNNKLEETLIDRPIGDNHCGYVTSKMVYKNISYWPMLYLSNAATAETGKGYYVAIGTEININVGEYENEIPAWWVKPNGDIKTVTNSEENLMGGNTPIIILSNGTQPTEMVNAGGPIYAAGGNASMDPPYGVSGGSNTSYNSNSYSFRLRRYRLGQRFENIGNSEYCITLGTIPTSAAITSANFSYILSDLKIAEVDKDDINQDLYPAYSLFGVPAMDRFLYFITYERDLGCSTKYAVVANFGSSNQLTIPYRAKYDGEIYHTSTGQQIDVNYVNLGDIQTYNYQGSADIQRAH